MFESHLFKGIWEKNRYILFIFREFCPITTSENFHLSVSLSTCQSQIQPCLKSNPGFSILLPSLWPYLQYLSPTVNYSFLGIAAAGYSIGQLIASPLLGKWSTHRLVWVRNGPHLRGPGGGSSWIFSEINFLVVSYKGDRYLSDAFGPMKKYCS